MKVTKSYIREKYNDIIEHYEKEFNRNTNIGIIPEDITEDNIQDILKIMENTGYTFLASYCAYKNSIDNKDIIIVPLNDIRVPYNMTPPSDRKMEYKRKMIEAGKIKYITLGEDNVLEDGYATFMYLKHLGELFIPCKINYGSRKFEDKRAKLRRQLYELEDGKCYICGRHVEMNTRYEGTDLFATIDHVIPISKGGKTNLDNCKLCCQFCNLVKSDREYSSDLRLEILLRISKGETVRGYLHKRKKTVGVSRYKRNNSKARTNGGKHVHKVIY